VLYAIGHKKSSIESAVGLGRDPWRGALASLRSDHAIARGVCALGIGRHGLPSLERIELLACERQAEGLQARRRDQSNAIEILINVPAPHARTRNDITNYDIGDMNNSARAELMLR
jgi:hypothetical protein